jgi:hypothetical protein
VFSTEKIRRKKKHPKMNRLVSKSDILRERALKIIFEKRAARNSVAPKTIRSRYMLYCSLSRKTKWIIDPVK